ncbi:MAG: family 43 glycosylhydrolase [Clostridia bacterium]|nr:family 43 glycosylhydrolase [Clostridia bacterium]
MKRINAIIICLLVCLLSFATYAAEGDAYYLCDSGTGDGSTAAKAGGSLADAYNALLDGGTIVVCGPYTISESFTSIAHTGKITITSVYGGVDYRTKSNAALIFGNNMYCGGETEFCNIVLNSSTYYPAIYAYNYSLTLGNGIECGRVNGSEQNVSVMGGGRGAYKNKSTNVTINSGKWQRVRGGTAAGGSENYVVNLTINGGEFIEKVTLGSSASHGGDIYATINGGTFYQGLVGATLSADTDYFYSNVYLNINGGTFYAKLSLAANSVGVYSGSFNVSITGGEFAHLVDFEGTSHLGGSMTSILDGTINFGAPETGTYTFTNPVRNDGADPWLFYHDGYYYYTSTTSTSAVKLTKVTNIGDLMRSNGTTIYTPEEGKAWSNSTWSPTILHYTDEEVGEGNGGWYLYFGGEDETDVTDVGHRMYVLKCLDGDNLLGRWGNPVTGEVNVPQRVSAPDIEGFDDVWAAGQGDVRINGKLYTIYVTEEGRYTSAFHQTINILPMTNPWTFEGTPTIICKPTYDWEMHGYGKIDNNLWAPKVVEAVTPVYGDDGSVFLVYSGSNYTTDYYCLGQLKFKGGDPMVASNWQKKSTPILSQGNGVRGTGSASYVVDTSGQGWVCYNAYLDSDESRTRHAMVEPYTATSKGVVIGDGSGIAAPETKVYTAALNPLSLADKASGFTALSVYGEVVNKQAKLTFTPVEGATAYLVRRDGRLLGSTTDLEYTDTEMPQGMHTYKIEALVSGKIISNDIVRLANYDGLVYGDMDSDSDIDVKDALILLKDIIDEKNTEASLLDVMKLMKCIF